MSNISPEELTEAIQTLHHQPAFDVVLSWLEEVKEDQVRTIAIGGSDPYRQYLETGVLQGILRIKDMLEDEATAIAE